MRLRYLIPALIVVAIGLLIWQFWGWIVTGLIGLAAWRMFFRRTAPRYMRHRGLGLGESCRKWLDTLFLGAVAYRVGPRQAKSTPGIPQRVLKRVGTQLGDREDLPF